MDQHKLYRTIRSLAEQKFRTEDQLLNYILESIIRIEEIPIKGGRIWKLEAASGTYRIIKQHGEMDQIKRNFRLRILDYPMFVQLWRKGGSMLATETHKYLRRRGITTYAATGVGELVHWKGHDLYPYVIAINGDYLKNEMTYALNIISNVVTSALKSRTIEHKAQQLAADLDKAREIQKSILPEHELRFHSYDLYGVSLPDRVVGGDFFDYLHASDDKDRLGVVIGDAASKGLSAAAQALYVSGALRMGIEYQTKIGAFISKINKLVNRTFSAEHFISMVYAELTNSSNGLVFYVNAGHSNPILLRTNPDEVDILPATGQLLGPFPNEKYATEFTLMKKGDILLLHTDGITDASDENHEMYGQRRLVKLLREHRAKSPREICQLILEDVQKFNKIVEYSDDKTLVVIKRTR
jgi:sigma-B regulation protein RsbU (phosphoserine phosphatase)